MRAFVSVEVVDQQVLEEIVKFQKTFQSSSHIKASPVKPENIHFTLLFLGDITEEQNKQIQDVLKTINFRVFKIKFSGIGAFPRPRSPSVIWIGVDEYSSNRLIALAESVKEALLPLGFKRDKPFKPHLTIFRIKNKIRDITVDLERYNQMPFGIQSVNEIKLKKSILTSSGPNYSDLQVISAIE